MTLTLGCLPSLAAISENTLHSSTLAIRGLRTAHGPHARTRTEQRFALPCGDFATANDKHGTIGQVGEQWIQLHRAAISGD